MTQPPPSIYLNNAATTFPKPEAVGLAVLETLNRGGSAKRDAAVCERPHDPLNTTRERLAAHVNAPDLNRVVFTPGCTYALNLAIQGVDLKAGDTIVISALEHHAVSRPARKMCREKGAELVVVPYTRETPFDLDAYETILRNNPVALVACSMAANVSGDIMPAADIARLARAHGALCVLDGAQAVGHAKLDVQAIGADMVSIAGHKGLFGPPGVGALVVREGLSLRTLAEGGTGGDSGVHELHGKFPADHESGTLNLPAIAGLGAGLEYVESVGLDAIHAKTHALTARFLDGLVDIPGVITYGPGPDTPRTAVVSLNIEGKAPKPVADRLGVEHGVVSRAGFHCAPMAHEAIGSHPLGGTVRFSPGWFTTECDIDHALDALRHVARS